MSIENAQSVLSTVWNHIGGELKTRVGAFLDRAEQSLYSDTSPRVGARHQPTSYAAARWLTTNRAALEAAMLQRLTESFFGRTQKKEVQFDELQLLDDDALGVVVVRASMVSQVMQQARGEVLLLEARLSALRDAGAAVNPKALNPGVVADGFLAVLNQMSVPKTVQVPLLEAYGLRGVEMLVEFYAGINELLIKFGVLPDLKNIVSIEHAASPSRSQTTHARGAPGAAAAAGFAPPPGGMTVPSELIPVLLDAKVTAMQQALANLPFSDWRPGTLRAQFELPPPFALTTEQQDAVDHLEAVFLDLLRDPRISSRFRTEMSSLILPLMMLRIKDADLLTDPDNPVRRFVRQLALLGFRDEEQPIGNFNDIRMVIARIVSERAQEVASFRSGADALHTIARNEVQRQIEARLQNRRPATAEVPVEAPAAVDDERRRLVREAHQHVLSELRLLSTGLRLPPPVQQYVVRMLGPWMMIRYQRYGVESEPMRDARSFAMMFFRLLTPASGRADHDTKIALRKHALEEMEVRAARSNRLEPELRVAILNQIEKLFGDLDDEQKAGVRKEFGNGSADCTDYLDGLEETVAD